MAIYKCSVCETVYDEEREGKKWDQLPKDWACRVCESGKPYFNPVDTKAAGQGNSGSAGKDAPGGAAEIPRPHGEIEKYMNDIRTVSETGQSIIEPMRTTKPTVSWDLILVKGAQLAKIPLNREEAVKTETTIGPRARQPLSISTPVYVTHMSFGALSREVKIALAKGSAAVKTAMCSGEGGILPESLQNSYKYIFEYVPNEYSVTDDNLKKVDAIEVKVGQSVKPGMGGHLPGVKVTKEIAAIRGFKEGSDIISPSHFRDIKNRDDLKKKVDWLKDKSDGRPVGIKLAAGNIEADLEVALFAGPDFITIDGRPGATAAAPKFVKAATSLPTVFALYRARKFLDQMGAKDISLVITGGLRISSDFAKALALGADAIAIGTAALMACACQQYRICHTGKCPMGVTTQNPQLRSGLDIDRSAKRLENFLRVSTEELKGFARLTGNDDVHKLSIDDLCTTSSEISNHTEIQHV